jgi:hypothetical protein
VINATCRWQVKVKVAIACFGLKKRWFMCCFDCSSLAICVLSQFVKQGHGFSHKRCLQRIHHRPSPNINPWLCNLLEHLPRTPFRTNRHTQPSFILLLCLKGVWYSTSKVLCILIVSTPPRRSKEGVCVARVRMYKLEKRGIGGGRGPSWEPSR